MIDNIKETLKSKLNKDIKIVINEGRSRKVEYIGRIENMYSNIFTIKIDDKILSYSYSDVLTKKIILI